MQVDTLRSAAHTFADLVQQLPDDRWDGPGLGSWDLRALVGHTSRSLMTIETYLQQPAEHIDCTDAASYYAWVASVDHTAVVERGIQAGRDLGAEPKITVTELVRRILPLVDRDADPVITTAAGGMLLSAYLPTRTVELVVHSHDIAVAVDVEPPAFEADVLREVLGVLTGAAVVRGLGPLLVAGLTGRISLPPSFSLV